MAACRCGRLLRTSSWMVVSESPFVRSFHFLPSGKDIQ